MTALYTLRNGVLWRRIEGFADATSVIDTHLALLVDIHDGTILTHGALRFVKQDRANLMGRESTRLDRLTLATLEETLLVYAKPVAELTDGWIQKLNALLLGARPGMSEIETLFPGAPAEAAILPAASSAA